MRLDAGRGRVRGPGKRVDQAQAVIAGQKTAVAFFPHM
jgi:hypothetical protein